jgi:hypothetical protein
VFADSFWYPAMNASPRPNAKFIYTLEDRPSLPQAVVLALQHVQTMFGAMAKVAIELAHFDAPPSSPRRGERQAQACPSSDRRSRLSAAPKARPRVCTFGGFVLDRV